MLALRYADVFTTRPTAARVKVFSLLTILSLLPAFAAAELNPKNGNFLITYQDMVQQSSGRELNLRRTFNSRSSTYSGWFGWGWNSPYETRLYVLPDGSVLVRESGAGLAHFYDPATGTKQHEAGLEAIVAAARARNKLDAKQAGDLRAELQKDEEKRAKAAAELGVGAAPPSGTKWVSRTCGSLERIADGWRRKMCLEDKYVDYFSPAGVLLRREDETGFTTLVWNGDRLDSVKDSSGLSLHYAWASDGRVVSVTGSSGATVRYTYSPTGELVLAEGKTVVGERMNFTYDSARRLTRMAYTDTTTDLVTYDDEGLTTAMVNRLGEKTLVEYGGSDTKYWTKVRRFSDAGNRVMERTYEFDVPPSATGEHTVERVVLREGELQVTFERDGAVSAEPLRRRIEEAGPQRENAK